MRVLHVLSGLDPRAGGPANALSGLALAQAEAGLEVSIVSTWREGWDESLAHRLSEDERINVHLVGPIGGWRKTHRSVPRATAQEVQGADVVHIHALWETIQLAASKSARQHRKPVIFRPCGMLDPWSMEQGGWKKRAYLKYILRRELDHARLLHYTTQAEADLAAKWALKPKRVIIPNGLHLPEFDTLPPRGAFRAKHGIGADTPVVFFMGRLHPKKGLDLLIHAFEKATRERKDAVLIMAGPPYLDMLGQLERLAAQREVADRVRFVGMLAGEERVQGLVDADLFVLPSRQENFGIVVAEAMAAGRPVVVSDQVNLHHEVTAVGAGSVVGLDIGELAQAISRWLEDEDGRVKAGKNARAFARERWDWRAIARQWATRYEGLCATQ